MGNFWDVVAILGKIENKAIITNEERDMLLRIFKQENYGIIERFLDFKKKEVDMVLESIHNYSLVVDKPAGIKDMGNGDFRLCERVFDDEICSYKYWLSHVDGDCLHEILPVVYTYISDFDERGYWEIQKESWNWTYIYTNPLENNMKMGGFPWIIF